MRKLLIIIGSILAFFILAIVLVPILFKDRIIQAVQTEIDNTVNANVNFQPDKFRVSLLSDFPNLTVGVRDFSITGKDVFEGDTLFASKDFSLEVDIVAIIKGEPLNIKGIILDQPTINILVLEDGTANYDIMIATEEEADTTTTEEEMELGIDHWEIKNGNIRYYDQAADMALSLLNVNHTGEGDFTQTVFDMTTSTTADDFSFAYDGDVYVEHKTLKADMILGMNLDSMKFTFKETTASLNEFTLNFNGFLSMPTDDIKMDINFNSEDTQFKSILSLVPGMYAEGFENLETTGEFDFNGFVKGVYNEERLPAFNVNLNVRDGFVKSPEVPLPVKNIGLQMMAKSETGDLKDGVLEISDFGLTIDQDRFTANAIVNNFDSPSWNLNAQGNLNLDIISKIEPTKDFSIGGVISADINSKGNYIDVEQENYQNLNTSGTLVMNNFSYVTAGQPDLKIAKANLAFNPEFVELSDMQGNFGRSDFQVAGRLTNYVAYVVKENALLSGQMDLSSQLLDINEMMGPEQEETTPEDTAAMEVVEVPRNIDFTFNANVQSVLYDVYNLKNARGKIIINNGILSFDPISFDMLGGGVQLTGYYNSQDLQEPEFALDLDVNRLSIPETYKKMVTVQKFVPVAEKMEGQFSTTFAINGFLTQEMMPDFPTLTGSGVVKVLDAAIVDSKIIQGVTTLSKLDRTSTVNLKDLILQAEIEDGKLHVQPFDISFDKYKATIDGYTAYDGSISYNLMMTVPTGAIGQQANQAISGLLGKEVKAIGNTIKLNFNVGGTYDNPDIQLGKASAAGEQTLAETAKSAVKEKIQEEKEKLEQKVDEKVDAVKDSTKIILEQKKKQAEEEAKKKAEEEQEKLKKKAKDKLKDIFGGGGE